MEDMILTSTVVKYVLGSQWNTISSSALESSDKVSSMPTLDFLYGLDGACWALTAVDHILGARACKLGGTE